MEITASSTIKETRAYLKDNIKKGTKCPCCSQNVKLYRRPITSTSARALLEVYRHNRYDYFHVGRYLLSIPNLLSSTGGGDFAKLRYWGLVEMKEELAPNGTNRNGEFRVTQKGRDFVEGKIVVEKYIYMYNNKQFDIATDESVSFRECLGKKFNFDEILDIP